MINLKFNPETKMLLVKEEDFVEFFKLIGGAESGTFPGGPDCTFSTSVTLSLGIETKELEKAIESIKEPQ